MSLECTSHTDCQTKGTYCTKDKICANTRECFLMKDAINDNCPTEACLSNGCEDASYCTEKNSCYCSAEKCFPRQIEGIDLCENDTMRNLLSMPKCNA